MIDFDDRIAIFAEAGTGGSYASFALGALVCASDAAAELEAVALSHVTRSTPVWDSSEESGPITEGWRDAILDLLRAIRDSESEFRVIVCRKADFRVWQRDRDLGALTAFEELAEDLTAGAELGQPRPRPRVTDAHQRQNLGASSLNLLARVPTDLPVGSDLNATQALFVLFVSAIAADTDQALDPRAMRSRPIQDLLLAAADAIGVTALRNDTWPPHRQEIPGEIRHNIWHFPKGFRGAPDVSSSIIIEPAL